MKNNILLGIRGYMIPIPSPIWKGMISKNAEGTEKSLGFMSEKHHLIRDFVVRELPYAGKPITPEYISQQLGLPIAQVNEILEELEKHLTFLYRNEQKAVEWAYPVTVAKTPHHVTFSTGEQVGAAWAADVIATPFVQGRLQRKRITTITRTECSHCAQQIEVEIDSELNYQVLSPGAKPLILIPMVNFRKLLEPSIIDAFWRKSVFFWSEEHAREYCKREKQSLGLYVTLDQGTQIMRDIQGAVFAFEQRGYDWKKHLIGEKRANKACSNCLDCQGSCLFFHTKSRHSGVSKRFLIPNHGIQDRQ